MACPDLGWEHPQKPANLVRREATNQVRESRRLRQSAATAVAGFAGREAKGRAAMARPDLRRQPPQKPANLARREATTQVRESRRLRQSTATAVAGFAAGEARGRPAMARPDLGRQHPQKPANLVRREATNQVRESRRLRR